MSDLRAYDQNRNLLADLKQDTKVATQSNESQATKEHIAGIFSPRSQEYSHRSVIVTNLSRRRPRQARRSDLPAAGRLRHQRRRSTACSGRRAEWRTGR